MNLLIFRNKIKLFAGLILLDYFTPEIYNYLIRFFLLVGVFLYFFMRRSQSKTIGVIEFGGEKEIYPKSFLRVKQKKLFLHQFTIIMFGILCVCIVLQKIDESYLLFWFCLIFVLSNIFYLFYVYFKKKHSNWFNKIVISKNEIVVYYNSWRKKEFMTRAFKYDPSKSENVIFSAGLWNIYIDRQAFKESDFNWLSNI